MAGSMSSDSAGDVPGGGERRPCRVPAVAQHGQQPILPSGSGGPGGGLGARVPPRISASQGAPGGDCCTGRNWILRLLLYRGEGCAAAAGRAALSAATT